MRDYGDEDALDAARYWMHHTFGWDFAKEGTESYSAEGLKRLYEALMTTEPVRESEFDHKVSPAILRYIGGDE